MDKLFRSAAVYFVIITVVITLSLAGTYSGGNGKVASPFKIGRPQDLLELSVAEGDWGASFVVINDVDMAGVDFSPISPSLQNGFTGSIDGNNFTICNMQIKGKKGRYIGLFGAVGAGGKISNLRLKDVDIDVAVPDGVDKDNHIYAGGFAGNSQGEFFNCSVSGKITAASRDLTAAGGICGRVYDSVMNRCESSVMLRALSEKQTFAGGLIGYCYSVAMLNNLSTADVYAAGSPRTYAGGLTGYSLHTKFSSCCSDSGSVLTDSGGLAGGLTGYNYNGHIANCYAVNDVFSFSNGFAGGLAGGNYNSIIKNCYFSGKLSQRSMKSKPGVFAGINTGSQIINCYWNIDSSLVAEPIAEGSFIGNVTMLTAKQINAGGIFCDPQWNADSPVNGPLLWEVHADKLPTLNRSAEAEEKQ